MEILLTVAFFLTPYLLGSITAAVIVSKSLFGKDIRNLGSNNAGSTNMFRELGFKAGVLTQIIDIGKGSLAAAIPFFWAWWLPEHPHTISHLDLEFQSIIAGMMAVIGHIYPVFFGFKGGKGINTLLGMMLVTNWLACLICVLSWVPDLVHHPLYSYCFHGRCTDLPHFPYSGSSYQVRIPQLVIGSGGIWNVPIGRLYAPQQYSSTDGRD